MKEWHYGNANIRYYGESYSGHCCSPPDLLTGLLEGFSANRELPRGE